MSCNIVINQQVSSPNQDRVASEAKKKLLNVLKQFSKGQKSYMKKQIQILKR